MKIPNCVGIIMDGNRRWAKEKGLSKMEGHRAGADTLKNVATWARDAGVKHLILYTFSTENWNRTAEEVSYLLNLIGEMIENELDHFNKENGILHFVGDLSRFSPALQEKLLRAKEKTKNNTGLNIYLALNYGGRAEILSAVKKIISENPKTEDVNEEYFSKYLQSYPMPDPDVVIRTSGELRLSGFLPWQTVYSELFFTKTLWPDFSREEFSGILEEYDKREIRRGK